MYGIRSHRCMFVGLSIWKKGWPFYELIVLIKNGRTNKNQTLSFNEHVKKTKGEAF